MSIVLRRRLGRLFKAIKYSISGIRSALLNETSFREECLVFIVLILPLGLYIGKNGIEKVLLIGSWFFVIIVELINSAIEAVIDRAGKENDYLSGIAKDYGSAAVFCTIILAILTWFLVLLS